MKRLLSLAIIAISLIGLASRAQAQSTPSSFNVLCAGDTIPVVFSPNWPDSQKKTVLLNSCLQHIIATNKVGASLTVQERNNQTGQALSTGFSYASNFCWCSNPSNAASCTAQPLIGANTAAVCNTQCSSSGAVSRRFEATYKDYSGTTNNNKCGNYCWCMEPTSAQGTETRCTLHRTTSRTIGGASVSVPLTDSAECTALCPTLRAGTRTGSAKHYETTFRDYAGSNDCSTTQPTGATPPAGSGGQTPSTPPPVVRLFNPMAGATTIVDIVNRFIKILMGLVGAGALLMFIYGGIKWMTAGGDSKNVADAQMILKNSALGLLLLIFAYSIVSTFFSVLT